MPKSNKSCTKIESGYVAEVRPGTTERGYVMHGDVLKNFVNGQWQEVRGVDTLPLRNPATGELLAKVPLTSRDQLDRAVSAAKDAFEDWRQVPAIERARYLFRYKTLLDENKEELAC